MAYTLFSGTVTAAGTINTKGAYTQLTAATPYASSRLCLLVTSATAAQRNFLIDLATGGAGAESIIVPDVAVHMGSDATVGALLPLTVDIAAGVRLAARCQSGTASAVAGCYVYLDDRALTGVANPVTYGATSSTSRGTAVDPGAVAGTKSAYVQLTAATAIAHQALLVNVQLSTAGASLPGFVDWGIDVATGAAGAETIILPDLNPVANLNDDRMVPPIFGPFGVTLAAGTRLAVRARCSSGSTGVRQVAVSLIGLQEGAGSGGEHAHTFVGSVI